MSTERGGMAELLTLRAISMQTLMSERTDDVASTPDMMGLMRLELSDPGPGGVLTPQVAVNNALQMAVGAQNLAALLLRALSVELERDPREILQKLALSLAESLED